MSKPSKTIPTNVNTTMLRNGNTAFCHRSGLVISGSNGASSGFGLSIGPGKTGVAEPLLVIGDAAASFSNCTIGPKSFSQMIVMKMKAMNKIGKNR